MTGPARVPAGVVVPAELAAEVLAAVSAAARAGHLVSPRLAALVVALGDEARDLTRRRLGMHKPPVVVPAQTPEHSDLAGLVSTTDVARVLGCSRERARQLAAGGRLSARFIGGRWLVDPSALAAYREERSAA